MEKYLLSLFAASSIALCSSTPVFAANDDNSMDRNSAEKIEDGTMEFTVSGAGTSDKDFDQNIFNLNASLAKYLSRTGLVGIRQSASANNNQEEDETDWNGSTRVFYDYHFDANAWRPLIGISFGYLYGETLEETWIAGPELGVKYYVDGNTFVAALVEYQFLFDDADDADEQLDDGVYIYSVGMGVNF